MTILPDVGIERLTVLENNPSSPPGRFIYRGGQPGDKGFNWLKSVGVTDIIKLNEENESDTSSDVAAEALGIKVHYFPIPIVDQIIFKPNKEEVQNAVNTMETLFTEPTNIFVHCHHGEDRTGLIVGCYRVWKQGWNKHTAGQEMLANGFHKELLGLTLFWEWVV